MFVYRSEKGGFSSLQPKPEKELQRSASRYILWVFHTAVRSSPVCFIIHKCRENPNNSGKNHKCFTLSSLKQVLVTILPRDTAVKQTQSTRRVWQLGARETPAVIPSPGLGARCHCQCPTHIPVPCPQAGPGALLELCWHWAAQALPHTGDNPTSRGFYSFTNVLLALWEWLPCNFMLYRLDCLKLTRLTCYAEELPQIENFR